MTQDSKDASRKYVRLEVDAAIYNQAKALGLPVSHIFDQTLGRAVHITANRETIERELEEEARILSVCITTHGNPMVELMHMSWRRKPKKTR
jgi:post-segregation antitoxin (ccd killing protein)